MASGEILANFGTKLNVPYYRASDTTRRQDGEENLTYHAIDDTSISTYITLCLVVDKTITNVNDMRPSSHYHILQAVWVDVHHDVHRRLRTAWFGFPALCLILLSVSPCSCSRTVFLHFARDLDGSTKGS